MGSTDVVNDQSRADGPAELSWNAVARQMRIYRLLLWAGLVCVGVQLAVAKVRSWEETPPAGRDDLVASATLVKAEQAQTTAQSQPASSKTPTLPGEGAHAPRTAEKPPASRSLNQPGSAQGPAIGEAQAAPPRTYHVASDQRHTKLDQTKAHKAAPLHVKIAAHAIGHELGAWLAEAQRAEDKIIAELPALLWPAVGKALQGHPAQASPPKSDESPIATTGAANHPHLHDPVREMPLPVADILVLSNPRKNGGAVRFLVDGRELSLAPGQSKQLSGNGAWRVEFHRGGELGEAHLSLTRGSYRFAVTRAGWDLRRERDD